MIEEGREGGEKVAALRFPGRGHVYMMSALGGERGYPKSRREY